MDALNGTGRSVMARSSILYELAKRRSWNASMDLDWSENGINVPWPFAESDCCFSGFAPFDALPESERQALAWQQHVLDISEIYYGEEAAMHACARVLQELPCVDSRHFVCSQLADEARHSEFFFRYLQKLGTLPVDPGSRLKQLFLQACADDSDLESRLLTCQLIIESLAMGRFADLQTRSRVPLLRRALTLIRQDEARHVNFGINYLKQLIGSLTDDERDLRGCFVLGAVFDLAGDTAPMVALGARQGWEPALLRRHLRAQRIKRVNYPLVLSGLLRSMRSLDLLGPRSRCLLQLRGFGTMLGGAR